MRFDQMSQRESNPANMSRLNSQDGKGNRSLFNDFSLQHLCKNPLVVEAAALTKSVLNRQSPRVPAIDSCWTYIGGHLDMDLTYS